MILPTILSRTQRLNIPRIEESCIANTLQTKYVIVSADAQNIAHTANGSFVKALDAIHLK